MEQLGDMLEGEFSSLIGMCTSTEESDFITQFLGDFSPETEFGGEFLGFFGVQSTFLPAQTRVNVTSTIDDDSFVYSSDPSTPNACLSPQETSTYSGSDGDGDINNILLSSSQRSLYQLGDSDRSFATNDIPCYYNSVDFGFEMEENVSVTDQVCTDLIMLEDEGPNLLKSSSMFETEVLDDTAQKGAKKRAHNAEAQKNKRNVKPRKSKKVSEVRNTDESKGGCGRLLPQTSSSNCLKTDVRGASETIVEEFSNMTQEVSPPPTRNGKTRANRGSATDPQSLYARKRREKINERLRILQGLVPNGTKVDISTMLDEAVQYVKFLQLQIKLLSSDDMWMYAPLAYNGMDLGLDMKL